MRFWFYGLVLLVFTTQAWAADCGDTTGPGGTRVPCQCGDTVTTSTKLRPTDPVVSTGPTDVCSGDGLVLPFGTRLTLNCNRLTLRGSGGAVGVHIAPSSPTVRQCTVKGFEIGLSIFFSGNFALQSNTVAENLAGGILLMLTGPGTVENNRVGKNGGDGIVVAAGGTLTITKNRVFGNANGGVVLRSTGNNTLTGNRIKHNGADGLLLDLVATFNEVANNSISDNSGNGLVVTQSHANLLSHNNVSANSGVGITIAGTGNTIVENTGKRNGEHGLTVERRLNVVTGNEFNLNGGHGICAIPGNSDGGGNIGKKNGELPDVAFGGCSS